MDKEVFKKILNQPVQIINDEHFVLSGRITQVYDTTIAFFTDGSTKYLSFDRILEIRPRLHRRQHD